MNSKGTETSLMCSSLFVLMFYIPVNNFSVMSGLKITLAISYLSMFHEDLNGCENLKIRYRLVLKSLFLDEVRTHISQQMIHLKYQADNKKLLSAIKMSALTSC